MPDNFSESLDRQLGAYQSMGDRQKRAAADRLPMSGGWKKFAAATGASLVSATSADAAITHVMPGSPIRLEIPSDASADFLAFDLNNNGANDAQLGAVVSYSSYRGGFRYLASVQGMDLAFHPQPGNSLVIRQFAPNEVIPAVAPAENPALLGSSVSTYSYAVEPGSGNWGKAETGLAGFVFGPAGSKRAGWIQIRTTSINTGVNVRMHAIEVVQWAYETVPGVSILAGKTSSGGVPGDYNNNGTVGPEDYTLWKTTFNNNVTAGSGADGNASGKVDAADYTVWRNKFTGAGSGAEAATVPEPATVTLGVLALGAAGIAALRRRAT